jgi:hypothetical protein
MGVEMMNMEVENVFVPIGVSQVWVDECYSDEFGGLFVLMLRGFKM